MPGTAITPPRAVRRSDLDWLRVLGVLLLVPFHSALVFNLDPNSIVYAKDHVQSAFLVQMAGFIHRWHMPLLFAIAGAATWFALGRRSAGAYQSERVRRLLVPAAFGILTLIPFMTNVHWLGVPGAPSTAQAYARFFTLNPADLAGYGGTFTPGHLWFILYLFAFSLLALPAFLWLRRPRAQQALATLAGWPAAVYLFVIPLALASAVDFMGDKNPLYYFLVFLAGYLLVADARFDAAIDRLLIPSAALALAATAGSQIVQRGPLAAWSAPWLIGGLLYQLSRWTWVLAILAAGHRWLNRESPLLSYASQAAYPFYILHLPVDTLLAYYIVRLDTSIAVKYSLIVVLTTLASLVLYELVVRRVGVLRFCFGMKAAGAPRTGLAGAGHRSAARRAGSQMPH